MNGDSEQTLSAIFALVSAGAPVAQVREQFAKLDLDTLLHSVPSYYNQVGFYCFRLKTLDDGSLLRLHFWPEADRGAKTTPFVVHNHRFDFTSLVLAGSMENRIYEPVGNPQGAFAATDFSYAKGEFQTAASAQRFDIPEPRQEILHAGAYYTMAAPVFHDGGPLGDCRALTLLACGPSSQDAVAIGRYDTLHTDQDDTGHRPLTEGQIAEVRQALEAALEMS